MISENKFMLYGVAAAALALLVLVKKPGAAKDAGKGLGTAAMDFVGGVVDGAVTTGVNGASKVIGIPTTDELISDPVEAQAYRDQYGAWSAMGHLTASAYWGTHG